MKRTAAATSDESLLIIFLPSIVCFLFQVRITISSFQDNPNTLLSLSGQAFQYIQFLSGTAQLFQVKTDVLSYNIFVKKLRLQVFMVSKKSLPWFFIDPSHSSKRQRSSLHCSNFVSDTFRSCCEVCKLQYSPRGVFRWKNCQKGKITISGILQNWK